MRRTSVIAVVVIAATALGLPLLPATASGTASISGVAFEDADRDGVRDAGEAPMVDQLVYAYAVGGAGSLQARTGQDGRYVLGDVLDGTWLVTYSALSWSPLKQDWVPTTTGSIRPERAVTVAGGPTTVDFGWRRIVRSTTSPLSTYTSAAGLVVESYNDAVTAREVFEAVAQGDLGSEQPHVVVRLDHGPSSYCSISSQRSGGTVGQFRAVCSNNWSTWVDQGDYGVSHEYGHAWSSYRDLVLQQDGSFSSYLQARGLAGDSRVGSSYLWDPAELVAEDYRQLLGSPSARAVPQANRELPPAQDVPGLKDFLVGAYSQPRPPAGPAPSEPAAAPLIVGGVAMSPSPVTKSGTAGATLSDRASVTVHVLDARGSVVRTLLESVAHPAGTVSAVWDRKTTGGRRAAAGDYVLRVTATAEDGETAVGSATFQVR